MVYRPSYAEMRSRGNISQRGLPHRGTEVPLLLVRDCQTIGTQQQQSLASFVIDDGDLPRRWTKGNTRAVGVITNYPPSPSN